MDKPPDKTPSKVAIPDELAKTWYHQGFSLYSLIDLCGGEDKFYEALFTGKIPEDWATKARAALNPDDLILARLLRIETKLLRIEAKLNSLLPVRAGGEKKA